MNLDLMLLHITLCSLHILFMKIICMIQMLDLCFTCGRYKKENLLREAIEEIVKMIKVKDQS